MISAYNGRRNWFSAVGRAFRSFLRESAGRRGWSVESGFDALEPRAMLASTPLPTLAALERPENAVVRFEIVAGSLKGDVDIELFGNVAPITSANFLNYVTSGRFADSFFHRVTSNASAGLAVLQGGAFQVDDRAGFTVTPTDTAIAREDTGRNMAAGTIAMARQGGAAGLNTATDQFFFNLTANPAIDTPGNNQFFAFGRVIQGFTFVQQLGALTVTDLSADPKVAGNPNAGALGSVPTTDGFSSGSGLTEAGVIVIRNAWVVKQENTTGFFSSQLLYPEGQKNGLTSETINLFNPNTAAANVQVIAHFERTTPGDVNVPNIVVSNAVVNAGASLSINLSTFSNSLLRSGVPYSIELRSAVDSGTANVRPLAATLERVDFNATAADSFYNPAVNTSTEQRTWDIPRLERNALSREFIAWQNLGDSDADITLTFVASDGTRTTGTVTTEAFRRGGVCVADMRFGGSPLADGTYAVRVSSTQPLVVSYSDFDLPGPGVPIAGAYQPGWGSVAVAGGGATAGAIAAVQQGATPSVISFSNFGLLPATVTLNYWQAGRAPGNPAITRTDTVLPGRRLDVSVDGAALGLGAGERVSLTYSATNTVSAQYTEVDAAGRNLPGKIGDGSSTMFSARVAPELGFTGVVVDPSRAASTQSQTLSLFNPFADSAVAYTYAVSFRFADGTSISGPAGTLAANQRLDFDIAADAAVRAKAATGAQFQRFAVVVTGAGVKSATATVAAPIAVLSGVDTTTPRSVLSVGTAYAGGLLLTDSKFAPISI